MFRNFSTIIVGNGSSLLENKYGNIINQFDIVVRFNSYTINGFEDYVGTKTDYWYNTINFINKSSEWRMKLPYKKIILHSWQWDQNKDELYKSFIQHYRGHNMTIEKTKRDSILEIQNFIGNSSYFHFSTGVIAIWDLLKQIPNVVIIGFDWWDNKKHHYNDNVTRGNVHKPNIEYECIKKLKEQNKLIFLDQILTEEELLELKEKKQPQPFDVKQNVVYYRKQKQETISQVIKPIKNMGLNLIDAKKLRKSLDVFKFRKK